MAELTIQQAFDLALQHHQAGRLAEAEPIYRQILSAQPNHATSLHHLGLIALAVGQKIVAANLIRKAISLDPNCAEAYNNLGNALADMEKSDEAISCYRKAIALKGNYAVAHSNLGAALKDKGELDNAIASYRRALQHNPDLTEAHYNLGDALSAMGKLDQGIDAYRQALRLSPGYAEAHNNLGYALFRKRQLHDAVESIRMALSLRADFPEAACNLGIVLTELGKLAEAKIVFAQALASRPDYAEAHVNLATVLLREGKIEEAIASCERAIFIRPDFAEAYCNLGNILAKATQTARAIESYRQAVAFKPDFFEAHYNLANALSNAGELTAALEAGRRAVALDASHPEAHNNLANILKNAGKYDDAIANYQKAIALRPTYGEAHNGLGNALKDTGQIEAAVAMQRKAVALEPESSDFHSNLILSLHYCPTLLPREVADEEDRWDKVHAEPLQAAIRPHRNDLRLPRRLKVGYVSPDFMRHAVGQNIMPLFLHHDHERFEISCYSNTSRPDDMTRQFQSLADRWRDISNLSDEQSADLIRDDEIDILVDLSLHTAGNRLKVLARKPAPVQACFAGYPGSTGLTAIDYRISDPYLDPPAAGESVGSERIYRLPRCFWCFDPLENAGLAVNALPAMENDNITFGFLGNFCKVNDSILPIWLDVLRQVPGSRLKLLAPQGQHREALLDFVNRQGIDPARIEFLDRRPRRGYLQLYQQIDIGLDSFPYNGHTTSLDSFWMGVPVITLMGQAPVARAGWCQLSNLGLTDLAAQSDEQFVRAAVKLANDLPRLAHLRATLRERMQQSPLMDSKAFALSIEAAYQAMWKTFCEHPAAM